MRPILLALLLALVALRPSMAQEDTHLVQLDQRLKDLAVQVPGLQNPVSLSVSGVSIQEFLRGLAETSRLNLNIDPSLQDQIFNNFQSETPANILLFLAKAYNLELTFVGTIISVSKRAEAAPIAIAKPINGDYYKDDDAISLSLDQDSLMAVARFITQRSGTNVLVTNELRQQLVSLYVERMSLPAALGQLAFVNRVKLLHTSNGSYVFMPLGPGEEHYINGQEEVAIRRNRSPDGQAGGAGAVSMEMMVGAGGVKLINVEAANTPVGQVIRNAAEQVDANYFLLSELQGNVTTRLKQVSFDQLLGAVLRGSNQTYRVENGVYLIGDRRLEGLREVKVVQLQHRSIDTIMAMIPAEWKQGVEVKEFREQNTLLLAGASPQISEIVTFVEQLDKRVPMILIEVNMLDIRKGHTVRTGIKMGISDSVRTGGDLLSESGTSFTFGARSINDLLARIGTSGTFNLGRVAPNFYLSINALENNNNVEVRSVPKLSTLNGHTASLTIGSSRYYSLSTQNVLGSLNPQTVVTQQFNKVDANMIIKIKPIVSGDEQVTLNIDIDISDFTRDTPINQPPPSTTSKFQSIIRVRNEETVVLGGIERSESTDSGGGVPVLSRIPVLKWLFSSKEKGRNKVVSVVFIKPTIIYQ